MVESCHITIFYTIGVYKVHRFMDNSADESQIGTLTGLLVRCLLLCAVWAAWPASMHIGWVPYNDTWHHLNRDCASSRWCKNVERLPAC